MSAVPERTIQEKVALAEERALKAERYRDKLKLVAVAEAEIPGAWKAGNDNKANLAEMYGISTMTVTRILSDNGIEPTRLHRLSDEEKSEILALIQQGQVPNEIATAYGTSVSSVRKLGVEAGLLEKGKRAPHRTDEEYRLIKDFDTEAERRFGARLYNLGMGLRSWEKKNAPKLVPPSRPTNETAVGASPEVTDQVSPSVQEPVSQPETATAAPEGDFSF